jgi:hypothetical protein
VTLIAPGRIARLGRWLKPSEIATMNTQVSRLEATIARRDYRIEMLDTNLNAKHDEANELRRKLSDSSRQAKVEAESLRNRIKVALRELHGGDAHAIVLSPKQVESLTWGAQSLCGRGKLGKIDDVQVYVARGVSGPLILNRDAFAAFSRQAPEMDIRKA